MHGGFEEFFRNDQTEAGSGCVTRLGIKGTFQAAGRFVAIPVEDEVTSPQGWPPGKGALEIGSGQKPRAARKARHGVPVF